MRGAHKCELVRNFMLLERLTHVQVEPAKTSKARASKCCGNGWSLETRDEGGLHGPAGSPTSGAITCVRNEVNVSRNACDAESNVESKTT